MTTGISKGDLSAINKAISYLNLSAEVKQDFGLLIEKGEYRALIQILDSYLSNEIKKDRQLEKLIDNVSKIDREDALKQRKEAEMRVIDEIALLETVKSRLQRAVQESENELEDSLLLEHSRRFGDKLKDFARKARVATEQDAIENIKDKLK